MQNTSSGVLCTLSLVLLCQFSSWAQAQTDIVTSEHVFRIRAACGGDVSFGTGFLSSEHEALVTALHVVDGACSISATSENNERFENLCIKKSSVKDDIAILWSVELAENIAVTGKRGYESYPDEAESASGPAISFGYARNTSTVLKRDTLSLKPKAQLADVVFAPDLAKWQRCGSPSLGTEVFRIEGIASPGDSGGPVFYKGDKRVVGVVSGGRAYDNVIWATNLTQASVNYQTNICPTQAGARLRKDECQDLRYFYTENEEERLRVVFGLPLKGSENSIEPDRRPWYQNRWIWAIGATLAGATLIDSLSDGGGEDQLSDPQTELPNILNLNVPLP